MFKNSRFRVWIGVVVAGALLVGGVVSRADADTPPGPIFENLAVGLAQVTKMEKFDKGATTIDIRKATIPVGGVVPWHCHPGPTLFAVVSGTLTTHNADGTGAVLGPGMADVEQVGMVRTSENLGDEDVVLYIAFAPPAGEPATIWLTGPDEPCPLK
jgi:quercetin dioxygenase-like cupin family protein